MMEFMEYYTGFMQDIYARAGTEKDFCESMFTDRMCEFLTDQAILNEPNSVYYRKTTTGLRVDAWDYSEDSELLTLMVTDYRESDAPESLSQSEVDKSLKRAEKFFRECLKTSFYKSLEESTPGYALAREIHAIQDKISQVKFILISNAELSKRVESVPNKEETGRTFSFDIWDISRLYRLESSGKAREDMIIQFEKMGFPGGIDCLPASQGNSSYESYLLVMPGELIARLYDIYGDRLLEQNVRTFLQFRGKVNKGMRNTILNTPEMFFAYNNGLTVTAESVSTDESRQKMTSVTNLQIVNGGQTTASLFTAMRQTKANLTRIYVQVKLSVVPSEKTDTVVPEISRYANTQNKVSAADFFSNHPFHLRIKEFSERLWAPSKEGGYMETHWFYERARGQFANAQATLSPAKQKQFLTQNPKNQMFTKTDLAKYEYSFEMKPHLVSKGAQANFALFAKDIGTKWDKDDSIFNEMYFRHLVAKAIIFKKLDKSIMKEEWYGGYKANIITYSIAKLMHLISEQGKFLDFEGIWNRQDVSENMEKQLIEIAKRINYAIQNSGRPNINVTQYCKTDLCWQTISDLPMTLDAAMADELIDPETAYDQKKHSRKEQKTQNSIHAQTYVVEKGSVYWQKIIEWNETTKILNAKELGIMEIASRIPRKIPSDKQSELLIAAERKAIEEGFFLK